MSTTHVVKDDDATSSKSVNRALVHRQPQLHKRPVVQS